MLFRDGLESATKPSLKCFDYRSSMDLKLQQTKKKSGIRETPTLSTDADSRTDTILERLRDLSIHTEKRTRSTLRWGLGPRKNADSVHSGTHPRFQGSTGDRDRAPEHILVFRALLKIEIKIGSKLRNTSSFLGLYSRSRSNTGTHTCLRALLEIQIKLRNTFSFLGLYSRSRSNPHPPSPSPSSPAPTRGRGPSW